MKTLDDALRDGCEVVGLRRDEVWDRGVVWLKDDLGGCWNANDKAIPAYVASLLQAKVIDSMSHYPLWDRPLCLITGHTTLALASKYATDWHRILAALVALGKWTIEEAREALKT